MSEILEEIVDETTEDIIEDPIEETPEENVKTFNVVLDSDGYFTGQACFSEYGRFVNGVDVENLPNETDPVRQLAYKLENNVWIFDEARYNELLNTPEEETDPAPTMKEEVDSLREQVDMLTECILEMSELMYV